MGPSLSASGAPLFDEEVDDLVVGGEVEPAELEDGERIERQRQMARSIRAYLEGGMRDLLPDDRILREHQEEALAAIADFLEAGHLRGYVSLPTGTGKTVLFSALARLTGARTLIVTPKKVLVAQSVREYRKYLDDDDSVGHVSSIDSSLMELPADSHHAHVVVATENAMKSGHPHLQQPFELVVWDEAHHATTPRAESALRRYGQAVKIGFTATPDFMYIRQPHGKLRDRAERVTTGNVTYWRNPDRSVSSLFPRLIYSIELREAIERGLLAPLRAAVVQTNLSLVDVPIEEARYGNDFVRSALVASLDRTWGETVGAVLDLYLHPERSPALQGYEKEQAIAFLPSVAQALRLAEALSNAGVPAAAVHAETPDAERETLFDQYRSGALRVLTSVEVLREGWDMPQASVALMLRPTTSRVLYQQSLGRVLRLDDTRPDKQALVVDFLGQYEAHQPLTAMSLFGVQEHQNGSFISAPPALREHDDALRDEADEIAMGVRAELIIIDAPVEGLPVADRRGFFEAAGTTWGSVRAWAAQEHVGWKRLLLVLQEQGASSRRGIVQGWETSFYAEQDVCSAIECLRQIPTVDADGFAVLDGERYGTVRTWARVLGVPGHLLDYRLRDAKYVMGHVGQNNARLFAERDVRSIEFPRDDIPSVPEAGYIVEDGVTWGTTRYFERVQGVTRMILKHAAKHGVIKERSARRGTSGAEVLLYREDEVLARCREHTIDLPSADEDGFILRHGERWATVNRWAEEKGTSHTVVNAGALNELARPIRGRGHNRIVRDYYPESAIELLLARYKDAVVPDASGFASIDGERWGTLAAWMRELELPRSFLRRSRFAPDAPCRQGAAGRKKLVSYYPETYIRSLMPEGAEAAPLLDSGGTMTINGERWATVAVLATRVGTSAHLIRTRLAAAGVRSVKARYKSQLVETFPESAALAAFPPRAERLIADNDQVATLHGERWASVTAWSKLLGVSREAITKYIDPAAERKIGIVRGQELVCYREADVRTAIGKLLTLPKADDDGTLRIEGEPWCTVSMFASEYRLSHDAVAHRVANAPQQPARTKTGLVATYYPRSSLIAAVDDLLGFPEADGEGYLIADGERWCSATQWSRLAKTSYVTMMRHLRSRNAPSRSVRRRHGQVLEFFPESAVRARWQLPGGPPPERLT